MLLCVLQHKSSSWHFSQDIDKYIRINKNTCFRSQTEVKMVGTHITQDFVPTAFDVTDARNPNSL